MMDVQTCTHHRCKTSSTVSYRVKVRYRTDDTSHQSLKSKNRVALSKYAAREPIVGRYHPIGEIIMTDERFGTSGEEDDEMSQRGSSGGGSSKGGGGGRSGSGGQGASDRGGSSKSGSSKS